MRFNILVGDRQLNNNIECLSGEILRSTRVVSTFSDGNSVLMLVCTCLHPIINARSETAAEKKTFQASLEKRRCVIPSTGYFEWNKEKQKLIFRYPQSAAVYLAGIWNEYNGEQQFCILTRAAEESIAAIHDRMPVILRPHELDAWLHDRAASELIIRSDPPILKYKTA